MDIWIPFVVDRHVFVVEKNSKIPLWLYKLDIKNKSGPRQINLQNALDFGNWKDWICWIDLRYSIVIQLRVCWLLFYAKWKIIIAQTICILNWKIGIYHCNLISLHIHNCMYSMHLRTKRCWLKVLVQGGKVTLLAMCQS